MADHPSSPRASFVTLCSALLVLTAFIGAARVARAMANFPLSPERWRRLRTRSGHVSKMRKALIPKSSSPRHMPDVSRWLWQHNCPKQALRPTISIPSPRFLSKKSTKISKSHELSSKRRPTFRESMKRGFKHLSRMLKRIARCRKLLLPLKFASTQFLKDWRHLELRCPE